LGMWEPQPHQVTFSEAGGGGLVCVGWRRGLDEKGGCLRGD